MSHNIRVFAIMSIDLYKLPSKNRPSWVEYPSSFCRLVEQMLVDLTPWHIMKAKEVLVRFEDLCKRYPSRELFPFAYRQDNDDIACWAKGQGEKVFIIHDFFSPGWENEGEFGDVWSWFLSAVEETIAWD